MSQEEVVNYYGSDFDRQRKETHGKRLNKLLNHILSESGKLSLQGETEAEIYININSDLVDDLSDALQQRNIYFEFIGDNNQYTGIVVRLSEYNYDSKSSDSDDSNSDDSDSDDSNHQRFLQTTNNGVDLSCVFLLFLSLVVFASIGMWMKNNKFNPYF